MKKRLLSFIMTLCMMVSLLPVTALGANIGSGETGARSDTVANSDGKDNVFLGNDKMELGINECGTFGSTAEAPTSGDVIFHPDTISSEGGCGTNNTYIGMRTYDAANSSWTTTDDFFLPGTVDEGFVFAWSSAADASATIKSKAYSSDRGSVSKENYTGYSTVDQSTANKLQAVTTAAVADTLSYSQTVSFATESGVAGVKLVLTNNSSDTLHNLEYIRAFDPDQGRVSGKEYTTNNYFHTDSDGTVWVIASTNSTPDGAVSFHDFTAAAKYPFIYMAPPSKDYTVKPVEQSVGWYRHNYNFKDVTDTAHTVSDYTYQLDHSTYADRGIGIRFQVPSLAAGASVTLYYNMSLDADIQSALKQLSGNLAAQPESYVAKTGDTVKLSVDLATLFPDPTSDTTYIYQWYSSTTEDGDYTSIGGASDQSYTAPTTSTGTTFYHCVVTPSSGDPVTTGRARVTVLEAEATTYSVTFDANTADTVDNMPGEQTVKSGDKVLEPDPPVRNDYVLAGWYTESAYTNQWDFTTSPTGNMKLYAKWARIPMPTVSVTGGKISAAHGSADDGQNLSTYTLEYSPDNGSHWYPYAVDEDGTGIDFTQFAETGYSETTANVLFRQVSTVDGIAGITGTTSATTLYKIEHSIAEGGSGYGSVVLAVGGAGVTDATNIGSVGSAYPEGASLTYTATPSSTDTSYFAGINGDGKFTDLAGAFAPAEKGNYYGGTYIFNDLSAPWSSQFYFGNWKSELAAAFADDTEDNAADLKAALGEKDSEARAVFAALFPDVGLAVYDNLTDKDQLLAQYVENDTTDTADEIVTDLKSGGTSAFESCVGTQNELEGNPTYPEVSVAPTTGIATVTLPDTVTNPTVTVKNSKGNTIAAIPETYTYDLANSITGAPDNYITVQVTDGTVDYDVTVRAYVNVSTYKAGGSDVASLGGTVGINSDSAGGAESTLDNAVRTDDIYTMQGIEWKKSDNSWSSGSLPADQPYKTTLTVQPEDGAYFAGFRYEDTLYLPDSTDHFRAACGDSAAEITVNKNSSSNPSDWTYTLTYTPKAKQTVTAQYRNLLGEINAADTNDEMASAVSDSNYAVVIPDAAGKQSDGSTDLTGAAAKEAFSDLVPASQSTVLTKLLNAMAEREDGYTIAEFNTALYWTSLLQQYIDEATDKVEDVYTAGSWAELREVLTSVKPEYDAADADNPITTSGVAKLCGQIQAALDQLTIKTLAVEIVTSADGTTNLVSFDAANPSRSGIPVSNGQNGYAFPVYATGVTLHVTAGVDYNVEYEVDDEAKSSLAEVNSALASVTDHTKVRIIFVKKTVNATLTDGVNAITADADGDTEGQQVNLNEYASFRIVPGDGQILIPGATVSYTVGGVPNTAIVQPDGTFAVNASGDIIITNVSAAVQDLDSASLTALLNALKAEYDSSSDTFYNRTDLDWTQGSWETLFGADNEGGAYGGVYGDALAVAGDAEATADRLQGAVDALAAAVKGLRPQYTVELSDGFAVHGAADGNDNPQSDVVKIDGTWYAAEDSGVTLDVTAPDGKSLNKVSYTMGGQALYAWATGGAVTIYGISGNINDLTMNVSDRGFTVTPTTGGIGAATGSVSEGNTYTLTPDEGNALVSITLDGLKTPVPDEAELAGIVSAAFADYADGKETVEINGQGIEFTKDSKSEIVTGTLPGAGKVQIAVSGSTVTATVLTSGSAGYEAGTALTITSDGAAEHAIASINVKPDGTEYSITFGAPAAGATVTWFDQNTGAHGVTAETKQKAFTVTIADDGEEPPCSVGGITADKSSVNRGGTVAFSIPAPADESGDQKEVSMDSTISFTVGGTSYSDSLADLNDADNGISAVINADGSATLTVADVSGDVNITAAAISAADRGAAETAQGLEADKALFTKNLKALQDALTEAGQVKTNTGKIYDETTTMWTALTDDSTGQIKGKSDLYTGLSDIDLDGIGDESALITTIQNKLGVESGTRTLGQLLAMMATAANELTTATDGAKIKAEHVISIPENTQYQGGGESVSGLTDKGNVGTDPADCAASGVINTNGGAGLVVSGIKTDAGYLPVLTYTEEGTDGSSYDVIIRVSKGESGFKAQIASTDSGDTTWTDTEDVGIEAVADPVTKAVTFKVTIPNGKLIPILGEDTSDPADGTNNRLGNISAIAVGTYSVGRKMSTAQEILDSTAVGSSIGVSQIDIDTANDGVLDFSAGSTDSNKDVTPVVSDKETVSVSFTFTQDSYAKGSKTWYKKFCGMVIDGVTYSLGEDGQFPEGSGLIYTKTADPDNVFKITAGKVAIDTSVYAGKLTGIELLCRPMNSQYTTYVDEYDEVRNLCGDDLSSLSIQQIESALKQIKRLIAQSVGTYAAEPSGGVNEYYLTQENKDYLATEIEQLKLLKRKLDALHDAKSFTDDAAGLYQKAIDAGLTLPLTSPITDEQKAVIAKLAADIENLENQYSNLTDYEKTLIGDAKRELEKLSDAVEAVREDGMTDEEIFDARVDTIDGMISDSVPYTIEYPDLALERINQAYESYERMSNDEQADAAVKKELLDGLKNNLQTYINAQAAEFAKDYLTTDYDGKTAYDNSTNRLDTDKTAEEYDNRVSLARESYDDLPACVKSAVDGLFKLPTLPQLYVETFPNVDSLLDVDDTTAADNFISAYLTVSDTAITDASENTYQKVLDAESAWSNLTSEVQAEVNSKLTGDYGGKTYPKLLELARKIDDAVTGSDTAAKNFINQHLIYDGSVITGVTDSNKSTVLDAKGTWDNLAPYVQAAVSKLLKDTYKGQAYSELYKAASVSDSGETGGTSGTPSGTSSGTSSGSSSGTSETSVPVIVDGTTYNIGTQKTANGVTTVTPDQSRLEKQLENAERYGTVTVPVIRASNASAGAASLVLQNIENMAQKNMTLTVMVDDVSYEMPTTAVDTAVLMSELGASRPSDVPVTISITESDQKTQSEIQTDLAKLGAKAVAVPLEFKVTANYNGKTAEVSRFEGYVSRTIEISREQSQQITTAIVHESDGTIRHIPTFVYEKDGKWYAKINSRTNSIYVLIYNKHSFADAAGKWYEDIVNEMGSRKIVEGRKDGKFHGEDNITRMEFATILVRALGLPADGDAGVFTDVTAREWYYGAVGTAYEYGLIYGRTATTFDPMADITRQEAMVMIARAAKVAEFNGTSGELTAFSDAGDVGSWALDEVEFDVGSGLIMGNHGKLYPHDNISRAELATIILRLLQKSNLVDVRSKT
ncbi:putative surface layer protein [Oscillibacter valericigenes Sjm18-20]|nr:putative surface layer protein [Oscillibacter valericigenes Sjm18-20]